MINIDIKSELKEMSKYRKKIPGCITRALNRALDMAKTESIRKIRSIYTISSTKARKSIRVVKAVSEQGEIRVNGGPIGLDHFKLYPKKRPKKARGIKVHIKDGIKNLHPQAFIAYNDGRLGAFERTGKTHRSDKILKNGKRSKAIIESIKRLHSVSVPQMMEEERVIEHISEYTKEIFDKRLLHELERVGKGE